MKLCRIGSLGKEKPSIIDKDNNYRDLSSVIKDFNPDTLNFETIEKIKNLDILSLPKLDSGPDALPVTYRGTLFKLGEKHNTPIYERSSLKAGQKIDGPAIVEQMDTTVLIFPGDTCDVDEWGNLIISLAENII